MLFFELGLCEACWHNRQTICWGLVFQLILPLPHRRILWTTVSANSYCPSPSFSTLFFNGCHPHPGKWQCCLVQAGPRSTVHRACSWVQWSWAQAPAPGISEKDKGTTFPSQARSSTVHLASEKVRLLAHPIQVGNTHSLGFEISRAGWDRGAPGREDWFPHLSRGPIFSFCT